MKKDPPNHHSLTETLERIRLTAEIPLQVWKEVLGVTSSDYLEFLSRRTRLPARALIRLGDYLHLEPERILRGQLDFKSLRAFAPSDSKIPAHYEHAAFGRMRTAISVLEYAEEFGGWRIRHNALRRLGVSESAISDPARPVSIHFITDLCRHLELRGYSPHSFREMGAYSLVTNASSVLSEEFARCRKPREVYERMFGDLLPFYERNSRYAIRQLGPSHCILEVWPKAEVAEAMGVPTFGSELTCQVKAGVMSSAMGYLGLPFADVREFGCIHQGDSRCRFDIRFERACYETDLMRRA
jgi:hypothetical protein